MREIKFRAWDKEENRFWYSDKASDNSHFWEFTEGMDKYQYTGLKDKNGKEIYERDIIDIGWVNQLFEVKIDLLTFEGGYPTIGVGLFDKSGKQIEDYTLDFSKSEIIGNIYENPELLK